jgi:hypothetical protein
MIIWLAFSAIAIAALRRAPPRHWARNPAAIAIPLAWGVASLQVGRLDAFFAMSVVGLMSTPVSALFDNPRDTMSLPRSWQLAAAIAAIVVVVATPVTRTSLTCIGFYTPRWPEPDVIAFLRSRALSGRIVTYFDWGEYGMWHMPRGLRVSMDGRRETVYSDQTISNHLELYRGTARGLQYLRSLDADYVWLPVYLPVVPLLSQHGWVPLFEGPQSVVFAAPGAVPAGGAEAMRPVKPLITGERCFPGP